MNKENVTQFTRKGETSEIDPFEQAAQGEEAERIGKADQRTELAPDLEVTSQPEHLKQSGMNIYEDVNTGGEEPESAEKPQPVAKHDTVEKGRGLAVTAIAMSVIAVGFSGFSTYTQRAMNAALDEKIAQLDSYAINTRMTQETIAEQIERNRTEIAENAEGSSKYANIRDEMSNYRSTLDQIKGDLISMSTQMEEGAQLIGEQRRAIDSLLGRVSSLEDQPVKTVTKVVRTETPKPKPKLKPADPTKIDGASVASIDAWGAQTNVMLRDGSGNWVPLSQGDYYNGWRFVEADGNTAIFTDGRKTKTIQVEG